MNNQPDRPAAFRAGRSPGEQPMAVRDLTAHPMIGASGVILAADISEFQPSINDAAYLRWSQAVIVRAAYGDAHDDHSWFGGARRQQLHDGGAKYIGFYQYLVAGQDITAQARAFTRLIGTMRPGEDLYADIEEGAGNLAAAWRTWAAVVQGELGWSPKNYSGLFFAASHGLAPVGWVAAYGTAEPSVPHLWWQFTDAFRVPGVGVADCSVFHGGYPDLLAHAYGSAKPPPPASWTETLLSDLPVLSAGATGEDVKSVQGLLNARGYSVKIDGAYGPATRAAVTAFQHAKGLVADGACGPATWHKLLRPLARRIIRYHGRMTCKVSEACNRAETPSMAASWTFRKNKYLGLGLCESCAAQAAYGHQSGFGPHDHIRAGHLVLESVSPPCGDCAPVVAGFPVPAAGGWRKHPAVMREFGGRPGE